MKYLKTAFFIMVFVSAHTAAAAGVSYKTGIIKAVDMDSNTFTVEFNDGGMKETYNFPNKVNIIDNGMYSHDKSLIEPGQAAKLKFAKSGVPETTEKTVKGIVVRFDSYTGKGILRQAQSNRVISFKLTKALLEDRTSLPKAGSEVEFTYIIKGESVATLD